MCNDESIRAGELIVLSSSSRGTAPIIDAYFRDIRSASTHDFIPNRPYIFVTGGFWITEIGRVDLVLSPCGELVAIDPRANLFETLC